MGPNDTICRTDGSWTSDWAGGIGFTLSVGQELKAYYSAGVSTYCPLQTEAWALNEVVAYVQSQELVECKFLTDSKELVSICQQVSPQFMQTGECTSRHLRCGTSLG